MTFYSNHSLCATKIVTFCKYFNLNCTEMQLTTASTKKFVSSICRKIKQKNSKLQHFGALRNKLKPRISFFFATYVCVTIILTFCLYFNLNRTEMQSCFGRWYDCKTKRRNESRCHKLKIFMAFMAFLAQGSA